MISDLSVKDIEVIYFKTEPFKTFQNKIPESELSEEPDELSELSESELSESELSEDELEASFCCCCSCCSCCCFCCSSCLEMPLRCSRRSSLRKWSQKSQTCQQSVFCREESHLLKAAVRLQLVQASHTQPSPFTAHYSAYPPHPPSPQLKTIVFQQWTRTNDFWWHKTAIKKEKWRIFFSECWLSTFLYF